MTNLILIEGIPGSGKSTTARKLEQLLKTQGQTVHCFQEGDLHPCDLAWHSCVPLDIYKSLLETYPDKKELLTVFTTVDETYAYVAYTKLELHPDHPLFVTLKKYEPYNGKVTLEQFKSLHLSRWQKFGRNADKNAIYIFECAYLQNHVVELMLMYEQSEDYIIAYMKELIETVHSLNPFLIYLNPKNVEWVIRHAANERKTDNPEIWNDWIDDVIAYFENSSYAKTNKLTGYDNVIELFKKRQRLELDIIKQLPIKTLVHDVEIGFTQVGLDDHTYPASKAITSL
jgi:energy-coupling factor transporter ATP-binding protein EcfA2